MLLPLSLLLDTLNNFVTFFVPPLRDTRNFTNKTLLCHCHSPFPFSHCCLLPPLFPLSLSLPLLPPHYPFALWSIAVSSRSLPQTKQTFWQRFHFHINFFVCLLQRKQQRQGCRGAGKKGRREHKGCQEWLLLLRVVAENKPRTW